MRVIIGIISIIFIIIIFRKLKKKTNENEYKDRTIKHYKRWHK